MADETLPIDPRQTRIEAADLLTFATQVTVDNADIWRIAREKRQMAKALDKKAEVFFKKLKQPHDIAKKAILDGEKEVREPLKAAIESFDRKVLEFEDHLLTERDKFRAELQERERQTAMDAQIAEAAEAERDGDPERARQILERSVFVPQVVLPDIEKEFIEGEGRNETWGVDEEVYDIMAIARAVVEGKIEAGYLVPNFSLANSMAKGLKETFNVPGFKLRRRRGITQR